VSASVSQRVPWTRKGLGIRFDFRQVGPDRSASLVASSNAPYKPVAWVDFFGGVHHHARVLQGRTIGRELAGSVPCFWGPSW
jgi:hypothetical protein